MSQTWTGNFSSNGSYVNTGQIRWTPPPAVDNNPLLVGDGPAECSSSTALSVLPGVIFDVNGYYRELGVKTNATRKDLRLAYQAADGQSSPRLTYIFRQLLQPEVRFEYDCTPLGHLFFDDYVEAWAKNQMQDRLRQRLRDLYEAGVDPDSIDTSVIQRDVAAEMGFQVEENVPETGEDTPSEVVDSDPAAGQDSSRPAEFLFAYYLWATRPRQDAERLGRLAEWQHLLIRALARQDVNIRFSVGFHGKPHDWLQAEIGYRTVFLLGDQVEPTEALATTVAQQYRKSLA